MKALTLWHPWAALVAIGAKRFETRGWSTAYRGPLAIHSALQVPRDERLAAERLIADLWATFGVRIAPLEHLPRGVVECVVDLVDVVRTTHPDLRPSLQERSVGNWSAGRFAWRLENVRPCTPPVPARGAQGLWEWNGSALVVQAPREGDLFDATPAAKETQCPAK